MSSSIVVMSGISGLFGVTLLFQSIFSVGSQYRALPTTMCRFAQIYEKDAYWATLKMSETPPDANCPDFGGVSPALFKPLWNARLVLIFQQQITPKGWNWE
jgi:hypothetical protein